jgi:NAD(P)-dependent dehydrogenase (short-subunit alcohol dehydrogenase family)
MSLLNEKVVLITGAKGGLGTHVTQAFLDAGARVIGSSRSIKDSDFAHPNFSAVPAELISSDGLAETIVAKWNRIDALVHLVGAFAGGKTIADTDDKLLDQMFNTNVRTSLHMMRAVLPQMRLQGSGRILMIGSKAAVEASPKAGAYAASKAALISLTRTVAKENADRGITANIVLPGTMDTPANREAMPNANFAKWVDPAQVANLLVQLVSDQSSQISGAVIPVYGPEL